MRLKKYKNFYSNLLKSINFAILRKLFFLSSLLYFCIYFFKNFDQNSFYINFDRYGNNIFLSFLFCILSIFFNALAWKNIVIWFGKKRTKNNLISFYVLTNVLKYVPGGIWHFVERFEFLKEISNPQLAFYSILIEPYFMLCASFLLASAGIIFNPFYFFLLLPLIFLNRRLIYFILKRLESFKKRTMSSFKISSLKYQFEQKIELISFFPFKAIFLEILFVLSKFIGFIICFNVFSVENQIGIVYLLVVFCLSWSIGLVVPAAPGGVGVFEACFLFFIGKNVSQNIVLVSLIYFRLISTSADLLLSLPFLLKKLLKKI